MSQEKLTHKLLSHGSSTFFADKPFLVSLQSPSQNLYRYYSYFSYFQIKAGEFAKAHVCTLLESLKDTSIVKEVIDSGILIELRRWIETNFMITRNHPHTRLVFKSLTEIYTEEVRHVLNYKAMIHPFSYFSLYFHLVFSIVHIIYLGYVLPIELCYVRSYRFTAWLKFAFDCFTTIGIFTNFYIGYWDKENMDIVLGPKMIAKRYLKTFFIWDLLSCLPSYFIAIYWLLNSYYYYNIIKWLSLFRLSRINTIDSTINMFRGYWGIPVGLFVGLQIILRSYFVILLCLAIIGFFDQLPYIFTGISEENDLRIAQTTIYEVITRLFGVGKPEIALNYADTITGIIITLVAYILQVWIMAKLYIVWQRYLVLSEVGEDHYQQLAGYLKYKGLPVNICQDIYCFYEFRFQKHFYDESAILHMLSDNLKKEIPNYRLDHHVQKIKFLQIIPNPIIMQIIPNMEFVYYCPGDVVFRINAPSKRLYYIRSGTVALHDENQTEVCHLEDGSYYGDIAVVLQLIHNVTMTAITPCKIFVLRQNVLNYILDSVYDIKEEVFELSRKLLAQRLNDWVDISTLKKGSSVSFVQRRFFGHFHPNNISDKFCTLLYYVAKISRIIQTIFSSVYTMLWKFKKIFYFFTNL